MAVMEFLQRQSKRRIIGAGIALVACLGVVDYVLGPDISFIVFYLIPVFIVTWFAGEVAGIIVSLLSGLGWFTADVLNSSALTHPAVPYINLVTKLWFFLIVSHMMSSLRNALDRERDMARTDYLTKVANSRYFAELAQAEINRAGRYEHPFTIAYLDIDNFKSVNDAWGHSAGDELLALMARIMRENIRSTDVVARMGGDEFALLLPETDFQAAEVVIRKVHQGLQAATDRKGWPVTFSIGVVTFVTPPDSVDSMIQAADGYMYAVKHGGKNRVMHEQVEYKAA